MSECRGFKNKLGTTIVSLIAKVTGAIAGNIATFNSDGELVDSGKSVDTQVTSGSSNLITSGAVYSKLNEKASSGGDGENFSVNKIIFSEGDAHASIGKTDKTITINDGDYYEIKGFDFNIDGDTIKKTISVDVEDLEALSSHDTTVTKNSSKLITSGAVYNGLQERPSRKEMGATIHSMLVLVKTSYHNRCQGRGTYDFQEYIETYTDANGRLWTIYLWSDGGADYFTLDSPAKMHIGTIIYEYSVAAIAAIRANTAFIMTAALTSFEYDTVGNI